MPVTPIFNSDQSRSFDSSRLPADYSDLRATSFVEPQSVTLGLDSLSLDCLPANRNPIAILATPPRSVAPAVPRTVAVAPDQRHLRTPSNPAFPRSKSSTAIRCPDGGASLNPPTKSILRRPNSPRKGARARFFSPRILVESDDQVGNESDLVDENGNFRARELVHEFEADAPPSCFYGRRPEPHRPPTSHQSLAGSPASARRPHLPRFTIPEPADLDIEPILPCPSLSTSPTLPAHPFMARSPRQTSLSMVSVNSLNLGAEHLSNIMDESGGFLADDTTWSGVAAPAREQTTEQSIDLNHVTMMQVLTQRSACLGPTKPLPNDTLQPRRRASVVQFESVEELDERSCSSFDVETLMRDMKGPHDRSMDQALKDEPVPENLTLDFSSRTFELSRTTIVPPMLPPLPTSQMLHHSPKLSLPPLDRQHATQTPALHELDRLRLSASPLSSGATPTSRTQMISDENLGASRPPSSKSMRIATSHPITIPPLKPIPTNLELAPPLPTHDSSSNEPSVPQRKRVSLLPPSKTSGLGLGLPNTARSRPKPSTATNSIPRGSPRVLKPRSSISCALVSPRRGVGAAAGSGPGERLVKRNEPEALVQARGSSALDPFGGRKPRPSLSSSSSSGDGTGILNGPSLASNGLAKAPVSSIGRARGMRPSASSTEISRPAAVSEMGRLMMRPSVSANDIAAGAGARIVPGSDPGKLAKRVRPEFMGAVCRTPAVRSRGVAGRDPRARGSLASAPASAHEIVDKLARVGAGGGMVGRGAGAARPAASLVAMRPSCSAGDIGRLKLPLSNHQTQNHTQPQEHDLLNQRSAKSTSNASKIRPSSSSSDIAKPRPSIARSEVKGGKADVTSEALAAGRAAKPASLIGRPSASRFKAPTVQAQPRGKESAGSISKRGSIGKAGIGIRIRPSSSSSSLTINTETREVKKRSSLVAPSCEFGVVRKKDTLSGFSNFGGGAGIPTRRGV